MKELEKLLKSYGLALDFIDIHSKNWNKGLITYLLEEEADNAWDRTSNVLRQSLLISIKNMDKFLAETGVEHKYKKTKPLIQKDGCVDISFRSGMPSRVSLLHINDSSLVKPYLIRLLKQKPEKFNMSYNELKMKSLYTPDFSIKKEIDSIYNLYEKMGEDVKIKERLKEFAYKLYNLSKEAPDDPEWFLDFAREKSKKFIQLEEEYRKEKGIAEDYRR